LTIIISLSAITLTEENSQFKLSSCYWPIRLSFHKTFFYSEAITSAPVLTDSTASMINVNMSIKAGKRRYNLKLWKLFSDVFNTMPVCAMIEDKILCMHGGLSPQLDNF